MPFWDNTLPCSANKFHPFLDTNEQQMGYKIPYLIFFIGCQLILIGVHFPIQNLEKIYSNCSSWEMVPVMLPK